MILLIFEIYSKETDYLYLNKQFNSLKEDNGTFKLYIGSQLLYLSIEMNQNNSFLYNNETYKLNMSLNDNNKDIILQLCSDTNKYPFTKNDIIYFQEKTLLLRNNSKEIIAISFSQNDINNTIKPFLNDNLTINKAFISMNETDRDVSYEAAYGEIIFIKYSFISYNILLISFFIIINGSIHKVLGIIFHATLFLYFFIKDIVELCGGFNYYHFPLFFFVASLITGILFSFHIYMQDNKLSHYKDKVLKASYGFLFCFFSFKSLLYYFTFFFGLNNIAYSIFLIIFILGGICVALGFALFLYEKLDKYSKYLYISCSAVSGSFFIVKSFGYILGGYYSDIIFSRNNFLDFDGACMGKIFLFFFLQILLIIGSIFYQIKNEKYRDDEEVESTNRSTEFSSRQSIGSKISNINTEDENSQLNINETSSNQNDNEGDDDNDINDQED